MIRFFIFCVVIHSQLNFCALIPFVLNQISYLGLGPTIAFNLKRPNGSWFGYREVEKLASLSGIQLRVNELAPVFLNSHLYISVPII